jgi:hypothetical protein
MDGRPAFHTIRTGREFPAFFRTSPNNCADKETSIMKKYPVLLAALLALGVVTTACQKKEEKKPAAAPAAPAAAPAPADAAKPAEPAKK